jgi:RNA polymerase sigma-70 factor (ECF subfamily)
VAAETITVLREGVTFGRLLRSYEEMDAKGCMTLLPSKFRRSGKSKPYSNPAAFSRLFDETHRIVFRYVYGLLGGPCQDVEDITADTFLKAWSARERFEGDVESAVSWLMTIARNQVIDRYRVQQRQGIEIWLGDVQLAGSDTSPEQQVIEKEQWERLRVIAQKLTEQQREILVLRYMLGWKNKQVADYLGIPENTVSVILRRTIQRLQTEAQRQEK